MAKDFYKISDLTEEFNGQSWGSISDRDWIFLSQAKFQLAIAQQLSVISKHLADLVAMCEEAKGVMK